jgi:hypothetical protein
VLNETEHSCSSHSLTRQPQQLFASRPFASRRQGGYCPLWFRDRSKQALSSVAMSVLRTEREHPVEITQSPYAHAPLIQFRRALLCVKTVRGSMLSSTCPNLHRLTQLELALRLISSHWMISDQKPLFTTERELKRHFILASRTALSVIATLSTRGDVERLHDAPTEIKITPDTCSGGVHRQSLAQHLFQASSCLRTWA